MSIEVLAKVARSENGQHVKKVWVLSLVLGTYFKPFPGIDRRGETSTVSSVGYLHKLSLPACSYQMNAFCNPGKQWT